ncbi:MAG: hypothetical protein OXN83_06035 [Oligoflexia bacterium]|nr:hypothetical protein [Oligoflexia bacterium]
MKNNLMKENYDFFISQLPKLLENKNNIGNYVLIENKEIIGIYDNLYEAVDMVKKEKKLEPETFIIQKIEEQRILYISRLHNV